MAGGKNPFLMILQWFRYGVHRRAERIVLCARVDVRLLSTERV